QAVFAPASFGPPAISVVLTAPTFVIGTTTNTPWRASTRTVSPGRALPFLSLIARRFAAAGSAEFTLPVCRRTGRTLGKCLMGRKPGEAAIGWAFRLRGLRHQAATVIASHSSQKSN